MTREEYGKIKDWDELIVFCNSTGCPFCEDIVSKREFRASALTEFRKILTNPDVNLDEVIKLAHEVDMAKSFSHFVRLEHNGYYFYTAAHDDTLRIRLKWVYEWAEENNVFADNK